MQHFAKTTFALFLALLATLASAQTLPTFKHIIIVVQENRTPDNIFGYWATGQVSGVANICPLPPKSIYRRRHLQRRLHT